MSEGGGGNFCGGIFFRGRRETAQPVPATRIKKANAHHGTGDGSAGGVVEDAGMVATAAPSADTTLTAGRMPCPSGPIPSGERVTR